MARAGATIHRVVDVSGRSATEVGRVVASTMAADADYSVAQVGPDSYQLVRTYQPTWALVAGIGGLAVFGLGILLLLVRRTESCTVVVTDGPTGATVAVTGSLLTGKLERLQEAIDAGAVLPAPSGPQVFSDPPARLAPMPVPPSRESSGFVPLGGLTPERVEETVMARPRASRVASPSGCLAIRLEDGRLVALDRRVLVGRDPAPATSDATRDVCLVPVNDPEMQVSKTHLAIGAGADGAWVEDLSSTNGTTIVQPGGATLRLTPGAPVPVSAGSVVRFGGLRAEVVAHV